MPHEIELQETEPELYERILKYGGTDPTSLLRDNPDRDPINRDDLLELYLRRKHLIVAEVSDLYIQEIPEGEIRRHSSPEGDDGMWVTVDGYVYDVTSTFFFVTPIYSL
jgi:cytochrome b involved in lipid metabolism